MQGTIKKVVRDRGFGFIHADDGREIFFQRLGRESLHQQAFPAPLLLAVEERDRFRIEQLLDMGRIRPGARDIPVVRDTLGRLAAMEAGYQAMIDGQIEACQPFDNGFMVFNRRYLYATIHWAMENHSQLIDIMRELYQPFVRTGNPILTMDNASAEMTKYAANALLATRISFMNEIANLCERVGADVDQVRRGISYDRRIGHHFLFPGVGYGGSCFPKDVKAVIQTAHEQGMPFPLLAAVEEVNHEQKRRLVDKVVTHFGADLRGRRFAVWGLAFKPRTDDMREAPSLTVVEGLLTRGAVVAVHDPEALGEARKHFGDRVSYHRVNYEALKDADALLIVTEWNEFRRPDFARMKQLLRQAVIFDGRNLYEPEVMREHGFTYFPIGRASVRAT